MIIKSNRLHEANCFGQKIDYILSDKERAKEIDSFEIYQNIRHRNRDGAVQTFQANDVYRKENADKKKIKNSVVAYHDILSFHHKDEKQLDQIILRDLTEQYIQLRCPNAVVFAKPHLHNKNLHVHILISGSDYKSKTLSRLSDAKWNKVRREIEKYQKEHYPQLENSLVYENIGKKKRKGTSKRKENERMMRERTKSTGQANKILDKDLMKKAVLDFVKIADSKERFFELVKAHGIETYTRKIKGKEQPYGVICNGRKMRFSTIGIKKETLEELNRIRVVEPVQKVEAKSVTPPKSIKKTPTDNIDNFEKEHQDILNKYVNYRTGRQIERRKEQLRKAREEGKNGRNRRRRGRDNSRDDRER